MVMIYEEVLLGFIWEVGVLDFVQVVFCGNWANYWVPGRINWRNLEVGIKSTRGEMG